MKNNINTNWITLRPDETVIWGEVATQPKPLSPKIVFIGWAIFWIANLGLNGFLFYENMEKGLPAIKESLPVILATGLVALCAMFVIGYFQRRELSRRRPFFPHWLSNQRLVYWLDKGHDAINLSDISGVESGFHDGSLSVIIFRKQSDPIVLLTSDADKLCAEIEGLITAKT